MKRAPGSGVRDPGETTPKRVLAPSASLRGACTAFLCRQRSNPRTKKGWTRGRRGGLSPFLMHGEGSPSPQSWAGRHLRCTPLIKKGDCPWHCAPSGTVTPFDPAPPSKVLSVAGPMRSEGLTGSSKVETVPLVHPFLVRGLLRCLHILPCRRLAMTGGGRDALGDCLTRTPEPSSSSVFSAPSASLR
jgi:hypothetical protein